jgi:hypothetical protein
MKNLFEYFVFGNFYIALCAVIMFGYTDILFSLHTDKLFIPFIFFSTLCSYSLHWYLTAHNKPLSSRLIWTAGHRGFYILLFIFSFALTIVLFFSLSQFYMLLLPLAFITFMYTAPKIPVQPFIFLRKIAVLKTTYLTLVWVFTTAVLPVLVSRAEWKNELSLFTVNRLFLIFPICILFDYRDRAADTAEGIKNIATVVSSSGLDIVFFTCVIINLTSGLLLQKILNDIPYFVSVIVPLFLLTATYSVSKHTRSDTWYYFFLDGLMMLGGLLYILLKTIDF